MLTKRQPATEVYNAYTETNIPHLQGRSRHPETQNRGGSLGQTARSAGSGFGWWRDARAQTEPGKGEGREKQVLFRATNNVRMLPFLKIAPPPMGNACLQIGQKTLLL